LDAECLDYLLQYRWPGNIRELENAIEHAAVLCTNNVILPEFLPAHILHAGETDQAVSDRARSLAEVEQEHIHRVLELTHGNRAEAAKVLQISQATLYRRLQKERKR
jgi:transcriptional regulator with PAS, ATPase and Fis domain